MKSKHMQRVFFLFMSFFVAAPGGSHLASAHATREKAVSKKIIVYYFHGDFRCMTCTRIEALTRRAVSESFVKSSSPARVELRVINVDRKEYMHFVKDYRLDNKSVVIAEFKGNSRVRWKQCPKIWEYNDRENVFIKYIQDEVRSYL